MNDLNKEEPTRYVKFLDAILTPFYIYTLYYTFQAELKECHYLVDLESSQVTEREPQYSQMATEWETIFQVDFLDSAG